MHQKYFIFQMDVYIQSHTVISLLLFYFILNDVHKFCAEYSHTLVFVGFYSSSRSTKFVKTCMFSSNETHFVRITPGRVSISLVSIPYLIFVCVQDIFNINYIPFYKVILHWFCGVQNAKNK